MLGVGKRKMGMRPIIEIRTMLKVLSWYMCYRKACGNREFGKIPSSDVLPSYSVTRSFVVSS